MLRQQLRYLDGVIYYRTRAFHDVTMDPDNVKSFLIDITPEMGEVDVLDKRPEPELWQKWKLRHKYKLEDSDLPQGDFQLNVLPLNQGKDLIKPFPMAHCWLWSEKMSDIIRSWSLTLVLLLRTKENGFVMRQHLAKGSSRNVLIDTSR